MNKRRKEIQRHHGHIPLRALVLTLLGLVVATSNAGTVVVDSINQQTPPGSSNSQQILIINSDERGNTQSLNIGHPDGTTVTGYKPCTPDKPTVAMDCSGKDLRQVDWHGARLTGGRFDNADLRGAVLKKTLLTNASFNNARLGRADLSGAQLVNCDFMNASLVGTNLNGADLVNCDFMNADLRGAAMKGARLVNADFMEARLDGAIWSDGRRCRKGSVGECRR